MAGHSATKQTVLTKQTGIPVREASVANLIRNWWRMCYAGNYSNLKELAAAEAERFGSTKQRGKVEIITSTIRGGIALPLERDWPAYALFPWNGVENPPFAIDMRFLVKVVCPHEFKDEVQYAIAAWVHLGGIGQRTRRGLGSLRTAHGQIPLLSELFAGRTDTQRPALLTTLPRRENVLVSYGDDDGTPEDPARPKDKNIDAWCAAVKKYRYFRQGEGFVRQERSSVRGHPGKSYYPEPGTIRRWTGVSDHEPTVLFDGFPRADLGLPIIFEFPGGGNLLPKTELTTGVKDHARFASPIITKAWWDETENVFRPLVAILEAPRAWEASNDNSILLKRRDNRRQWTVRKSLIDVPLNYQECPWKTHGHIREALRETFVHWGYTVVR